MSHGLHQVILTFHRIAAGGTLFYLLNVVFLAALGVYLLDQRRKFK